jgi:hypothetical protein
VRFEKLFLAVIMAPEIQGDKWQDKDKSARRNSRTHRSNPVYKWALLGSSKEIDATHQEESKKQKLNSTFLFRQDGMGKIEIQY